MKIDILTLFPEMCDAVLGESIIGRARKQGFVEIECHNIRDFAGNKHGKVDDMPYGGGMGMIMAAKPIYDCYKSLYDEKTQEKPHLVYMSPKGKTLTQEKVKELSALPRLVILCGHYEGVDERVIEKIADEEISVGDYVLTGGELPALTLTDAVCRMLPGVLSDEECFTEESHFSGLLEYPQYTRPAEWEGNAVPQVLLSGNHAEIAKWRRKMSLEITKERRPDMFKKIELGKSDLKLLSHEGEKQVNNKNDFEIENGTVQKYVGKGRDVVIPEDVKSIDSYAFSHCETLRSVKLPEGLTHIGKAAFAWCPKLEKVFIPKGVKKIGNHAFFECKSLKSVTISDGVKIIGSHAFCGCDALTEIKIPDSVSYIEENAFSIENLRSVTFGKPRISKMAFYACNRLYSHFDLLFDISHKLECAENWLIEEYKKGERNERIERFIKVHKADLLEKSARDGNKQLFDAIVAFPGLRKIPIDLVDFMLKETKENASFHAALTEYRKKNFSAKQIENYEKIKEETAKGLREPTVAELKRTWTYLGVGGKDIKITYYKNTDASVKVPKTIGAKRVVRIGYASFADRLFLKEVIIPEGVKKISFEAFCGCGELLHVYIPKSVTEISNYAFLFCKKLTIHSPAGSFAEEYAKTKNIRFEAV